MYDTNCKFKKPCDLKWDSLEITEDEAIRFCNQCKRNVYLATEQAEFNQFAVEGKGA